MATKAIEEWVKKSPGDLQKLSKYLKDVCEIRTKNDGEKIKMANVITSAVTGMPAKFKKANGKNGFELWITEGDSATSGLENNRDKATQALFPIRGKLPNCFMCSPKKFFENEEIAGLVKIFGYQKITAKFDPSQFVPKKVVIAADADADGYHIRCLVLLFFLKYFIEQLINGILYSATPPLYGIPIGKGKMKFFADATEYTEYIQGIFCRDNIIGDKNGKQLSKSDILHLLHNLMHYLEYLMAVGDTFAIRGLVAPNVYEYRFLEFLLYNYKLPYNKFKTAVEKNYRYVTVGKQNGTIVINGLVGGLIQTVFFNDMLLNECAPIIKLIEDTDKFYTLNNNPATLYDIMQAFSNAEPPKLDRYKGLGEMEPAILGMSTVIPGNGRILKQYTVKDAYKELANIHALQSDKGQFIKGIKVRKEDVS